MTDSDADCGIVNNCLVYSPAANFSAAAILLGRT
jgi:hypothetical protein